MAWNLLDDQKVFNANDLIDHSANAMLAELKKWAAALKTMR
jgi:hypothetical protein